VDGEADVNASLARNAVMMTVRWQRLILVRPLIFVRSSAIDGLVTTRF